MGIIARPSTLMPASRICEGEEEREEMRERGREGGREGRSRRGGVEGGKREREGGRG